MESPWKHKVNWGIGSPEMESVRLAIWDHRPSPEKPHPTAGDIIRTTHIGSSTVYKCLTRMVKNGEIERVKGTKRAFYIIFKGSPLGGKQTEQLIYENLHSGDQEIASLALQELDQLSRVGRIQNDSLLKLITDKNWLRSGPKFHILTRQAELARNDSRATFLRVRKEFAEEIARNKSEDRCFRDEAFLYLKVINPEAAVKVALKMIELDEKDEALDSTEPTQLWIDVSTTLALAARTQPSTRRQLYFLIEGKTELAAERARKIIEIALTQEQDTNTGTFGIVPPKPRMNQAQNQAQNSRKTGSQNIVEQARTIPNNAEQARTCHNAGKGD